MNEHSRQEPHHEHGTRFWISLVAAIPAGYVAAWPVNWWLIGRNLKQCH